MKRLFSKRALAACIVAACLLSIAGCRTKIGKIVANPDQFKNKQVVVYGEVARKLPIPFFENAAYLLKDKSGEMWVLTKRAYLPEVGQWLKVTGVVEAGIRVGPKEFGLVLSEQEKQTIKSK
ncbi:MAG TPA: hypothetical protein VM163_02185 [bacterium]|nr:hypothetical protein [bacterium]